MKRAASKALKAKANPHGCLGTKFASRRDACSLCKVGVYYCHQSPQAPRSTPWLQTEIALQCALHETREIQVHDGCSSSVKFTIYGLTVH